jgi:hypothetical protein
VQQSLRFDDDVVEAPCDPATDPAGCLIAPTVQLQERQQEVPPPIPPEPEAPVPQIRVTATAGPGGSITPATQTVNAGATARFTVTPDSGYQIASVTGCGGNLIGNTYTTGPITAACAVSASFIVSAPQIDVTGQWAGTFYIDEFPECKGILEVSFVQTGNQLTGFAVATVDQNSPYYCGPGESESSDLSGTVEGNQILYGVASGGNYTGAISADGNSIAGTAVDPDGYQATWELTRK